MFQNNLQHISFFAALEPAARNSSQGWLYPRDEGWRSATQTTRPSWCSDWPAGFMIGVSKHVMFEIGCLVTCFQQSFIRLRVKWLAIGRIMGVGRIVTRAFDVNFTCRYFSVSQLEIKVYDRLGREEDQGTEIPDGRWQVYLVYGINKPLSGHYQHEPPQG